MHTGPELSHRFYFVDSVATTFTSKLQQFYKLGQAYIHGQLSSAPNLHKEEQIEVNLFFFKNNLATFTLKVLNTSS